MADAGTLTLSYVSGHPAEAARVLERLPADEAAALFSRLPARAMAPVLAAMLPPQAARVIGALDDQRALGLLSASGVQGAVTILRHVPEPRRTRLVDGLSTGTAVASRMLLGFPEDAVGAWVEPEIVVVAPSATASEALERVRADPDAHGADVYVIGTDGRLKGAVALAELMRAPPASAVGALMRDAAALPAAMPLGAALAHAGWRGASTLPVVERGERLIGVLRAAKLDEALALRATGRPRVEGATLAGMAATGYWDAISGLTQAALALLPPQRRVLPEKR